VTDYGDVTVVMISKDEEGSIAKVLGDVRRDLPGAEILLVDSSADSTPKIAEEHGARVIRQFPPKGYGPAMARALLTPEREIVATLDCDDTYPTDRLPELIAACRNGVDIAGTTRLGHGRPAAMPLANYVANQAFNATASLLFRRRIRDVHTGMRAYRRTMLHAIRWRPEGPALPVELLLVPIRLGYRVQEVPIAYNTRIGESTLRRWTSTGWTFRRIFLSRFESLDRFRAPEETG
jgi:glycosyltransferase involved in cell wall biosynthesis